MDSADPSNKPVLDDIDRRLLAGLGENAAATNAELARAVGLSTSACSERLRRLRDAGVLGPPRATIDPAAIGIGITALVAVQLKRHTRATVEAFRRHAEAIREVVAVWHVTGEDDFMVHVVARDTNHLRDLTMDEFTELPEVARLRTAVVFTSLEKRSWPDLTTT